MAETFDDEVQRLEHELDILRSRLAIYAKWSLVLRVFARCTAAAVALLVLAGVVKIALGDAVMGLFIGGAVVAVGVCIWLLLPQSWRWIDIASPPLRPFSMEPAVMAISMPYVSDARLIEQQIAEREARLAVLRSNEAGS